MTRLRTLITCALTHAHAISLQSYKKKTTFANFREEKLQFTAFLVASHHLCLHKNGVSPLKIEKRSFVFLRESLPKCPILPCCNFEVGRRSRLGVLEFTKNPMFPNFPLTFCVFLIFSFLFAHCSLFCCWLLLTLQILCDFNSPSFLPRGCNVCSMYAECILNIC